MFNKTKFNQTYFNRQKPNNIYKTSTLLRGAGVNTCIPSVILGAEATFTGAGKATFNLSIKASVSFTGAGKIDITPSLISFSEKTFTGAGNFLIPEPSTLFFTDKIFTGSGKATFDLKTFASVSFSGRGSLQASGKLLKYLDRIFSGSGKLIIASPVVTSISQMTFSGILEPGDLLVIDTENFTADLNGEDVTYLLSDFTNLSPGENLFEFSSKTVALQTKWTENYL